MREKFPGEEVGIALAYCSYKDPDANKSASIISSLVRQLAVRGDKLHRAVDDLYRKNRTQGKMSTSPKVGDLKCLLLSLATSFDKAYLFVDGIDECEIEERRDLLSCLKNLTKTRNGRVRVFTTSRPHAQDIQRALDDPSTITRLDISAIDADIEAFVRYQVERAEELLELMGAEGEADHPGPIFSFRDRVISSITSRASGL